MFSNISVAGIGMYAFVIAFVFRSIGIELDIPTIETGLTNIVGTAGFFLWIWGQVRRKDLRLGFWRK